MSVPTEGNVIPRAVPRGVVAYLDVLGTKRISTQADAVDHALRIRGLHEYVDAQLGGLAGLARSFFAVLADSQVVSVDTVAHFSDSMFLWVPAEPGKEFFALSDLAAVTIRLLHYGLKNRLPLRGAISIGPFVTDEGIFIGEAVAEAVEWERVADWSGVVLAPSATNPVIREMEMADGLERTREFAWARVPTKGSPVPSGMELMTLAWPNVPLTDLRARIDEMYMSAPLPVDAAVKWINTMHYYDEISDQIERKEILPPIRADEYILEAIWETKGTGAVPQAAAAGKVRCVPTPTPSAGSRNGTADPNAGK